ncbi:transport and Golgi organization protein 1 homolog isoform X2 [Latimeria chalumnae]|uniref:transport and Golgi organization protein 1 homolog isoform X2 n=1 Tax=Latimeria chalumnae TaxID=7897 RepID=UPI0003C1254C|nr:PREDICTED: melanoma inhibitory activity protein 3 isoform X2 [Latimeria chalumnae]|eukprot:XP_005996085.1 PREDICTED: melanoma inhibitory activity protein 3 isoform X2 [Latimeria chalumnae]
MAATPGCKIYLLLLFLHFSHGRITQDRRFSDLKRCTDEECSMLMCRGKATQDFTGPDCRFVNLKKGETVYVYYKLTGRRTDLWAGSVGSSFGYFPRDLIEVNHIYSGEEIEVPAEETDFVCFDGGTDHFDNYNVDELLGLPPTTGDSDIKVSSDENAAIEVNVSFTEPPEKKDDKIKSNKEKADKKDTKDSVTEELPEDEKHQIENETFSVKDAQGVEDKIKKDHSNLSTKAEKNTIESTETLTHSHEGEGDADITNRDLKLSQGDELKSKPTEILSEVEGKVPVNLAKDPVTSQGGTEQSDMEEQVSPETESYKQPSKLKTTLGSTADAVVSDDEETSKVTSQSKDSDIIVPEDFDTEVQPIEDDETSENTFLLSYMEEQEMLQNSPDETEPVNEDLSSPPNAEVSEQNKMDTEKNNTDVKDKSEHKHNESKSPNKEKNLLTTLGDTVYAIVNNDEKTKKVTNLNGVDFEKEDYDDHEVTETVTNKEDEKVYVLDMQKDSAVTEEPVMDLHDDVVVTTMEKHAKDEDMEDISNTDTKSNLSEVGEEKSIDNTSNLPKEEVRDLSAGGTGDSSVSKDDHEFERQEYLKETPLKVTKNQADVLFKNQADILDDAKDNEMDMNEFNQGKERHYAEAIKNKEITEIEQKDTEDIQKESEPEPDEEFITRDENIAETMFLEDEVPDITQVKDKEISAMEKDTKGKDDFSEVNNQQSETGSESVLPKSNFEEEAKTDDHTMAKKISKVMDEDEKDDVKTTHRKVEKDVLLEEFNKEQKDRNEGSDYEKEQKQLNEFDEETQHVEEAIQQSHTGTKDDENHLEIMNELEWVEATSDELEEKEKMKLEVQQPIGEDDTFPLMEEELLEDENAADARLRKIATDTKQGTLNDRSKPKKMELEENSASEAVNGSPYLEQYKQEVNEVATNAELNEMGETVQKFNKTEIGNHDPLTDEPGVPEEDRMRKEEETPEPNEIENELAVVNDIKLNSEALLNFKTLEENLPGDLKNIETEKSEGTEALVNTKEQQHEDPLQEEGEDMRDFTDKKRGNLASSKKEHHEKPSKVGLEGAMDLTDNHNEESELLKDNEDGGKELKDKGMEDLEPEDEAVKKLTLLKSHFNEKDMERFYIYLGQKHVRKVEAMFCDLEEELKLARQTSKNRDEVEKALDRILESSESSIMNFLEEIIDERETHNKEMQENENTIIDEETKILDDLQELAYLLRQRYSTTKDSTPLAVGAQVPEEQAAATEPNKDKDSSLKNKYLGKSVAIKLIRGYLPKHDSKERKTFTQEKTTNKLTEHSDVDKKEDRSHLQKREMEELGSNKDDVQTTQDGSKDDDDDDDKPAEVERLKIDNIGAGNPEVSTLDGNYVVLDENASVFQGLTVLNSAALLVKESMGTYIEILIAALPEDMRPGPNFYGIPWEPVVVSALVGFLTVVVFLWRTVLAVKSRMYQVTEKQMANKIATLIEEKCQALEKVSLFEKKLSEANEALEQVEKQNTTTSVETKELENTCKQLEKEKQQLEDYVETLSKSLKAEQEKSIEQERLATESNKSIKELEKTVTAQSAKLSEVQSALNEFKCREEKVKSDLRAAQEENAQLKQSKEQLLKEAEGWSERHSEMNEQLKVFQMAQKDLEEALAYKENEIDVLTDCIVQLRQIDNDTESETEKEGSSLEKEGESALRNGELPDKKSEKVKLKIKQMMDVSRVKTTLKIVEEERDRFQAKLSDEEKARHELEERIKKLEHDAGTLVTEKSHYENECKTMQQKVEILTELYQQKEMALQKKLTQEEYQRQEKEQKLSAADEKAIQANQDVQTYRRRIQEMEEELEKTERAYKSQVSSHEKKSHENWLVARTAERALVEEKRATANLRQKVMELNLKMSELQRPSIVKPTPGRLERQAMPRRGPLGHDDSYGPSPVSGGAPSPPLMMEVPGRPPSATLGRREMPLDRTDSALRGLSGPPPPRDYFGPVSERRGPPSDRSSPPSQMGRRPSGPTLGSDIPPGPRRPPSETSGRISGPAELRGGPPPSRHDIANSSGPRTSSPSLAVDGVVNPNAQGPPSFPGTPIMNSPMIGQQPPPSGPRYGPPLPSRPYGPRPPPFVRGPPPGPRDYPFGPSRIRDLPPGPLLPPFGPRDHPAAPPPMSKDYPLGPPRDYPPGPLLPPYGPRDFPPPLPRDISPGQIPPQGIRDYPPGPPPPHNRR